MRKTLIAFALCLSYIAQGQLVLTVAGVRDSVGSTNGQFFQATFNNPHGIAVDPAGNIYTADRFSNKIRKITPGGIVSTLAGSGAQGSADGVGTNATFNEPWGLCVDSAGTVYVADTRNNLIRKITPAGVVTTIAGSGNFGVSNGQGTNATFGNPTGIEIASDGSIYVADHLTHIIRRITPNGFVTTLAGLPYVTGSTDGVGSNARFNRPYGLTLDNDGNILIADEWNHKIRKLTPAGVATTVAGAGVVGSTDGPASAATFNFPWDVTVDTIGNIFVGDGYNDVVRRIDTSGTVTTYVGTAGQKGAVDDVGPNATFNAITALAYLPSTDEIYLGDAFNNLVRKIINLNQQTVATQVISSGGTDICEGEVFTIKASPSIYDSYDFFVDNQLVQSSTIDTFSTTTLTPGNHSFQVVAYDNGTAVQSAPFPMNVNPKPNPSITVIGQTSFFVGDSVTLVSSNGDTYQWSHGPTSATVIIKQSGNYTVLVTNSFGCSGRSDTVTVTATPFSTNPVATFITGDETLCYGETATLTSDYTENNQWLLDGFPIEGATEQTFTVSEPGAYQVQVIDDLNFTLVSNTIDVTVLPKHIDDILANDTIIATNTAVQFNAIVNVANVDYTWDFGDPNSGANNASTLKNPSHTYVDEGSYTVTLITNDLIGCADTLTKNNYITVNEDGDSGGNGNGNSGGNPLVGGDGDIYIPTAFSPNNDGRNDVFFIRGRNIANLDMQIFNQWGEQIFATSDPTQGWDGTKSGQPVQSSTYVYLVEVELLSGEIRTFSGHITVLR